MVYELHIWGPAFGLPSIDPECLVTVAYLSCMLVRTQWRLVAAHDPSASPSGDFPVLYTSSHWIGSFRGIVNFLQSQGHSLDARLTSSQQADSLAYTSATRRVLTTQAYSSSLSTHIRTAALPLISYTLYGSTENYTSTTRPAFTRILPTHTNYLVPPTRRSAAIARAACLGLSTIDVDNNISIIEQQPTAQQQAVEREILSSSPSLLFRRKATAQAVLLQQHSRQRFRVEAIIADLLESIELFLGKKPYLFTDKDDQGGLHSVDCVAFGYLALLLYPPVPDTIVADAIREKFATVVDYVERMRLALFPSDHIDVEAVLRSPALTSSTDSDPTTTIPNLTTLPWRTAPSPTTANTMTALVTHTKNHVLSAQSRYLLSTTSQPFIPVLAALAAPVAAAFGYFAYSALHPGPPSSEDAEKVFRDDKAIAKDNRNEGMGDVSLVFDEAFGAMHPR